MTLFQKVDAGPHALTRDYLSTRYKCKQEYAWTRESVAAQLNSLQKSAWQLERPTPLILKAYKPLTNQPLITDPILNKIEGPEASSIPDLLRVARLLASYKSYQAPASWATKQVYHLTHLNCHPCSFQTCQVELTLELADTTNHP